MLDLLGDIIAPAVSLLKSDHGFATWWKAWPSGHRKVSKLKAQWMWEKRGYANSASHILAHTQWMMLQQQWIDGYVPMPTTYLNQQGWLDWEPPAPVTKQESALDKMKKDSLLAVPPPAAIRERLKELKGRT